MRIALISYEYPPETGFGGIGTYTHYHARALARLGHEVHVFAGTQRPERRVYKDGHVTVSRLRKVGVVERLLPRLDRLGLHWFKNRLQNAANTFAAVRRALADGDFDVVEMPECGGEGALINHCLDLPTVVRLHSPAELIMPIYATSGMDRALTAMVERLGMSGARAMSSCSHWLADEVRRRGLTDHAITVIPNGIDLAVFDQDEGVDMQARFGVPRDRLKVFFANRLEPRKGIHVVRDLMVPVLEKHPETVFVLAGADPDNVVQKELRPMLAARGLADRLFHLGRIALPEVRACLKQSDVFLLPSTWENAPYSLLEAMSAGKAIVASDCGGVPEMLRHDIDGLVVPTGDAAAFARAIDRLHTPSLRARLGQSARARIEARYTDDLVARRSLEFYQWALDAPAGGSRPAAKLPGVTLGPSDWFQAWWIRGAESGEPPRLGDGFHELGLDELAFVHAVSARVYWAEHARRDDAAASYLQQLSELHRARAVEGKRAVPLVGGALRLPALSHPLFRDDGSAEALLGELWRLGDHALVADWLERETAAPEFVERAQRRMALRRLAVEAFRRRPSEHSAGVLRRIYRAVGVAPRVVQQDEQFVAEHAQGAQFAAVVAELGLHAPLRRPAAFSGARRRAKQSSGTAQVTVLIPSFRHEAFVARAIESVLAQTHGQLRVLVVDDRSPDGTVAAARAIDDERLEVRVNDENLGLGGSIRGALSTIDTPYVALLNSDDVFHPERLQRCLEVLEADPEAQLVATRIAVMDDKERLLSAENSCVLDVGAAAHGWVRWYDRVTAEMAPEQWPSVAALLGHNHLATSSNVVCRTDFLRAQAGTFAPLKYCLDWSLFLHAAIDGALRVVPDELVGYRLHSANTVWFDEGARPGYVHEVNAVVADALRTLVARRRAAGVVADEVAEELAGLVQASVLRHGETDGLALLVAELTAGLGAVPAAFRSPELVRLAERALAARKAVAPQDVETTRRDRHAIDALRRRLRDVEPRLLQLEQQLAGRRAAEDDAAAFRARIDGAHGETEAVRAEVEAVRAELAAQQAEQATLQQRFDALQASLAAETERSAALARTLDATQGDVRTTRAEVAARDDALQARQAELDALAVELDEVRQSLAAARSRIALGEREQQALGVELQAARRRVEASEQRGRTLQQELRDAHRRHQQALERVAAEVAARAHAQRAFEDRLEHRFGRFVLQKMHLGGLVKTTLRLWGGLRTGTGRLVGGLRKQLPGRKPVRALLLADGAFPAPDSARLAGELLAVRGAGFDAHVVAWRSGSAHWLGSGMRRAADHRVVLQLDAALQARDRRWFLRRDPEVVAAIEALALRLGGDVAPVFSFARSARSLAAGYLHAVGLGPAALAVFGASRLGCAAFGLRLEAADLPLLGDPARREIAGAAAALFVDSEALAARVRARLGKTAPDVVVVPPLVGALVPTDVGDGPFVCMGPFQDSNGLNVLADAVHRAAGRGVGLRFVVLGAAAGPAHSLVAVERFRARLVELGMLDRFDFRSDADPGQLEVALRAGMAYVDVRTGLGDDVGGPSPGTIAAMASARAIVGFVDAVRPMVGDGRCGIATPAGDVEKLAAALVALHGDAERRRRLGAAARSEFDRFHAPVLARSELCARMRAVIHARSG